MANILQRKSAAERLQMALDYWTLVRDTIRDTAAFHHPDWSETELDGHAMQMARSST